MSLIRSRDTTPELLIRRAVHRAGYRFRIHRKDLPGRPDLVFVRQRIVVFVHGCFWHGHVCKEARPPKSNLIYWGPKIRGNVDRDKRNIARLRRAGWSVVVIRECDLDGGLRRLMTKLEAR